MIKKTIATLILVLSITSQIVAQGGGNLKKLNLSEEQKTKLTEIRKKNLAAIEAVKAKNITEAEKEKEIEEIKKSQKDAVKGILTPEQIAQMKGGKGKGKMKGKGKDKGKPNEDKEEDEKENDENDLDEKKEDKKKAFSKAHKEKIMDIKADSTLTKMEKAEALKNIKKENEGKKEKIKEKKEKKDKSKANKKEEE